MNDLTDVWIVHSNGSGTNCPVTRIEDGRAYFRRFYSVHSVAVADLEANGFADCPGVHGGRVYSFDGMRREADARQPAIETPPIPPELAALDLPATATTADIKRAYRRRAKLMHPDKGGSDAGFIELTRARDAALAVVAR